MKKKIFIFAFVFLLLGFFSLLKIGEKIVNRKISKLPFKIEKVRFYFFGAKVKNLKFYKNDFSLLLKEIKIKPSFTRMAFAFSGPGQIEKKKEGRTLTIKGKISGNIKNGNVNIEKTDIRIEKIGKFQVRGNLKNWGKNGQDIIITLNKVDIKDTGNFLNFKIPVEGLVSGKIILNQKNKKQNIEFDIKLEELKVQEGGEVIVFLKGNFLPSEKKGEIKEGTALIDGKPLKFNGTIDKENFSISFQGEKIQIEKLLKLLPEKIREKYQIRISQGTADFNNFTVSRVKKNLIFQVI